MLLLLLLHSIGLEAGIVGDHHLSPIAALKKLGCRGEHSSDLLLESCALLSSQLLLVNLDHMVVRLLLSVDAQLVVGVRMMQLLLGCALFCHFNVQRLSFIFLF